jgi:hypothetical protein
MMMTPTGRQFGSEENLSLCHYVDLLPELNYPLASTSLGLDATGISLCISQGPGIPFLRLSAPGFDDSSSSTILHPLPGGG